jgi:hypothetical protein
MIQSWDDSLDRLRVAATACRVIVLASSKSPTDADLALAAGGPRRR